MLSVLSTQIAVYCVTLRAVYLVPCQRYLTVARLCGELRLDILLLGQLDDYFCIRLQPADSLGLRLPLSVAGEHICRCELHGNAVYCEAVKISVVLRPGVEVRFLVQRGLVGEQPVLIA